MNQSNSSSKIKDCLDGSVSEEDSGVGSEGKESDVAEQTDTASNDDTDSLKPVSETRVLATQNAQ